jgi:TRAP-type uncharacterized transport system fused permease subunit
MTTGFIATRLGLAAYIIPFMFVYGPALLTIGEPLDVLLAAGTALVGVVGLAAAAEGWLLGRMAVWERLLTLGSALLLIKPGWMTDLAGLIFFGVVALGQFRRHGLQGRQVAVDEAS